MNFGLKRKTPTALFSSLLLAAVLSSRTGSAWAQSPPITRGGDTGPGGSDITPAAAQAVPAVNPAPSTSPPVTSAGLSPQAAPIPIIDTTDSENEPFQFGRDYLRISIAGVYFSRNVGDDACLVVTVTVLNKNPLTYKFALQGVANTVYSDRGPSIVVPFTALNSKSPLEIDSEFRTKKIVSRSVSSLGRFQNYLTTAGSLLTGGALGTVSYLTKYANASCNLVTPLESVTEVSDVNRGIVFDDSQTDTMDIPDSLVAVFTGGTGSFTATDDEDKTRYTLNESAIENWENNAQVVAGRRRHVSPYRFFVPDPNSPNISRMKATNAKVTAATPNTLAVYPTEDNSFVLFRLERYVPYPNLRENPDRVPGVAESFAALATLLTRYPGDSEPQRDLRQALIDGEATKLTETLRSLTASGDLSMEDARTLIAAFVDRASHFGQGDGAASTGYDTKSMMTLASTLTMTVPSGGSRGTPPPAAEAETNGAKPDVKVSPQGEDPGKSAQEGGKDHKPGGKGGSGGGKGPGGGKDSGGGSGDGKGPGGGKDSGGGSGDGKSSGGGKDSGGGSGDGKSSGGGAPAADPVSGSGSKP